MNYCLYLTSYFGNLLPPYYVGSSSVKKVNAGYRGSVCSKKYKAIWKNELKNNPQLFSTEIISVHESREEAYSVELAYQVEHDVVKSDQYINMSANRGLPNHKGTTLSDEHKRNVSNGVSLAMTQEVRDQISNTLLGTTRPDDVRTKISNSTTGKLKSADHIEKMRNRIVSDKTRAKQSLAKKGISTGPCSEEKRAAISAANIGKNSYGRYTTPWGTYDSAKLASMANNILSEDAVRKWCNYADNKISKQAISATSYLNNNDYGKTFREIGFCIIRL